jgi:cation transporter-like permease
MNHLYYFFYFAALYHFINKKIKILNVRNFAVVGDIFCGIILAGCEKKIENVRFFLFSHLRFENEC